MTRSSGELWESVEVRLSMSDVSVSMFMSLILRNDMVRGRDSLDSDRLTLKVIRRWSVKGRVWGVH